LNDKLAEVKEANSHLA
jgi:dTDP-4-amino-4,6-dideoxygalactose transaminase